MPTIHIHVLETHQSNGERAGSFTEPHPKVRVAWDDSVNWRVLNPSYSSFEVMFAGGLAPFTNSNPSITSETDVRTVAQLTGVFHYSVRLTIGATTYFIQDCPELEPVSP